MQEARDIAVTQAKTEATGLAKSAGITLGKVINVSETTPSNIRPLTMNALGGGTADKVVTAPSVQTGTTEIDVTVSLSYEVR